MGSLDDWQGIINSLSPHYRCLALDLPGHGGTGRVTDSRAYTMEGAAQAVIRVLDEERIHACPLVGYSMGGRLALHLGVHCPHRVSALVLESASPGIQDALERRERKTLDAAWARRLAQEDFNSFLTSWYKQPLFETLQKRSDLLERILARRRKNDPAALAKSLLGMSPGRAPALWDTLHRIGAPVLVLAGELDLRYKKIARDTAGRVPQAQLELVAQAGHNVHAENPAAFENLLRRFLVRQEQLNHGKN